tara:strand:+ start:206 stop:1036 length:831 start_codon:yes stop_codon:yes gene_type:complete
MNNDDDLLKNYIESQKRQREILEESKKRRDENNNQKETIDSEIENPEQDVSKNLLREDLEGVLATLSLRERDVLRLKYGIDDGRIKTLEEIGQIFDVTRERIRQIEAKALRKLRDSNRNRVLKKYIKDALINNPDDNDREKFQEIKKRVHCLDLASKCENEIEKIDFIDKDLYFGFTDDAMDDNWDDMKSSFLNQYDLDEDDYEFVFSEIEYICLDKERFLETEYQERFLTTKFKKINPNIDEFKKDFKLFLFSYYFDDEPHSTYRGEIEWIKDTW